MPNIFASKNYPYEENAYDVLSIPRGTQDIRVIKKAYMKQALKFHPDRNKNDGNAVEKFKMVASAYELLKDDDARRTYDALTSSRFTSTPSFTMPTRAPVRVDKIDLAKHLSDLMNKFGRRDEASSFKTMVIERLNAHGYGVTRVPGKSTLYLEGKSMDAEMASKWKVWLNDVSKEWPENSDHLAFDPELMDTKYKNFDIGSFSSNNLVINYIAHLEPEVFEQRLLEILSTYPDLREIEIDWKSKEDIKYSANAMANIHFIMSHLQDNIDDYPKISRVKLTELYTMLGITELQAEIKAFNKTLKERNNSTAGIGNPTFR